MSSIKDDSREALRNMRMHGRRNYLPHYARNFAWNVTTGGGIALGIFLVLKITRSSVVVSVNAKK